MSASRVAVINPRIVDTDPFWKFCIDTGSHMDWQNPAEFSPKGKPLRNFSIDPTSSIGTSIADAIFVDAFSETPTSIPGISAYCKRGRRKGATSKNVKNRQKVSKSFSTLFDNFRAGQKTSKIIKNRQKVFRHFSTNFARHHFSGPFWGALRIAPGVASAKHHLIFRKGKGT